MSIACLALAALWFPANAAQASCTNCSETTLSGGDVVDTFTSTTGGTFTPPSGVSSVQYLVVGGGGGGGGIPTGQFSAGAGGGGGGAYWAGTLGVTPGSSYTVTVGTGGTGGSGNGSAGGSSVFSSITAVGGGGGGGSGNSGINGGSGGGGSYGGTGGTGVTGHGHNGGGPPGGFNFGGGGGGGAGVAGANGTGNNGGVGGDGTANTITGSSVTYAGGGGGGGYGSPGGAGGAGGGGAGAAARGAGNPGTNGTGGGGGGATGSGGGGAYNGGTGGSGIVIIRYTPAAPVTNQISGQVFRDYNDNGALDSGEPGVSGITVTAYDNGNASVATTTTDSSGNYTLTGLTDGQGYRIEFTNVPSYLRPGPVGANSSTTVVFITSPQTGVDLGLQNPGEYSAGAANAQVATTVQYAGDPTAAGYPTNAGDSLTNEASAISIPYNNTGGDYNYTALADVQDLGATWGLAYQRSTHTLFAAAALKRGSGFGPLGAGGIYAIDTQSGNPATAVTNWLDVTTLGIPVGSVTRYDGTEVPDQPQYDLPADPTQSNWDQDAYAKVGTRSLGDIDFDESDRTLWVIDLYNRSLYGIENVDPANPPTSSDLVGPYSVDTSGISCTDGVLRPWGVKAHDGKVYVGAVCTGENSGATQADLQGYVLVLDPSASSPTFTQVLNINFDDPNYAHPLVTGETPRTGHVSGSGWQTWNFINGLTTQDQIANYLSGTTYKGRYSVPIVSDIEFDPAGDMIIGVMSRWGLMQGQHQYAPNYNSTNTIDEVVSAGDILHACVQTNGSYVLEGNTTSTCPGERNNGQGPGGAEFFYYDNGPDTTYSTTSLWQEQAIGALALLPGSGQVVTTVFDPDNYYQNGFEWYSTTDGSIRSSNGDYAAYQANETTSPYGLPLFGKGNGLGDIELLVPPPPIEIGNRVWDDQNADGIQDADEPGIPGVVVGLYDSSGHIVTDGSGNPVEATTDSSGDFYFSSASTGSASGAVYGVNIDSTGTYTLGILDSNFNSGGALYQYVTTTENVDGQTNNNAITDNHDSDGHVVTLGSGTTADPSAHVGVSFTNQGSGADNHSFDFGFYYMPTVATIGQVSLKPTSVASFLSSLDVSSMSTGTLSSLLQKWDPQAAASLGTSASRQQLLDALTSYLDPDGNGVVAVFHWDTLEEHGTIGFYVERKDGSGGWTRINNDLLPGLINSPMGAEYQLADPGAVSGQTYQYRLIEQEAAGSTRTYGPFIVEMP